MKTTLTFAQQADLLVRATQADADQEALAQLFEYFAPRWEYWLQTRWNCSPAEAEDLVADLRAIYLVIGPPHTHPCQFIARSKGRLGWMVMATQRREKLAPQGSLEGMAEGEDADAEKLACLTDKRDELSLALNRLELNIALAQLRPVIADVIKLHYDQGWDVLTIAQALKLPKGTVQHHLWKGRQELAALLTA